MNRKNRQNPEDDLENIMSYNHVKRQPIGHVLTALSAIVIGYGLWENQPYVFTAGWGLGATAAAFYIARVIGSSD